MLKNHTTPHQAVANPIAELVRTVDTIALTSRCAGCDAKFTERNPAVGAGMVIEPQGSAGYQVCGICLPRLRRDPKFRARVQKECFRTIFGAGPDSVGGTS
jgi:hypothetical protein